MSVGVGPFWYMRTVGTMRASRCAKPLPGVMNPCGSTVWFDVVMSTETWVGVDGTMRERTVEVSQRFASPADRARWLASSKPVPIPVSIAQGDALDVGSGHFPSPTFGAIAAGGSSAGRSADRRRTGRRRRRPVHVPPAARDSRPTRSAALARIDDAFTALRHRYGRMLLRWHSPGARGPARAMISRRSRRRAASIQELLLIAHLDTAPIPTHVRLGLFHAATALLGAAVTHLASTGVTVSASFPHWQPVSFTFDPRTGELLTGLPMDGGPPDLAGPNSTVVAQGPVGSIASLPKGVQPIPGVGAPPLWPSPPAPAIDTVSPAAGGPTTVFTVLLAATPGERAHPAPTAWLGITRLRWLRDLPRRETGVRPPRDLPAGEPGGRSVPPADVGPRLARYDDSPRRHARVRLPGRAAALPPQSLVRRPLPARHTGVPESPPAALHHATVHRP